MRKILLSAIIAASPAAIYAQSPVQAAALTQSELRGTARFMSMGGAFTALGADLSTLSQNPAGLGVYRHSEAGITLDINMRNYTTETPGYSFKNSQTKAFVNNVAYVGAVNLQGALRTFNFGVSYGRKASFDRIVRGYNHPTQTSLSNYIAAFSGGYSVSDLDFGNNYNPYSDSNCDWLSILGYSAYMINPTNGSDSHYQGLYTNGTDADAAYDVRESGYVDEYNIDLGGNVSDLVYWGIGIGVTDLSYFRTTGYSESMSGADIVSGNTIRKGNAGFNLVNDNHIWGTGCNIKLGLIVRPINELRIGLAVHTPTWFALDHNYIASVDYSYYDPNKPEVKDENPLAGQEETDLAQYKSKLTSPWRLMFGVAGIIGNRAIVSLDYERMFYNAMSTQRQSYGFYGTGYVAADDVNDAIKDYYQGANIVRLGLEYRVTPQFSVRLGYNVQTSNVTADAADGLYEVMTTGTDPSYSFDKTTQYISGGLGYRYKNWYIDAAYVYKNRKSTFHAYTDFNGYEAPMASVADNNSSIVLSTGFKF